MVGGVEKEEEEEEEKVAVTTTKKKKIKEKNERKYHLFHFRKTNSKELYRG